MKYIINSLVIFDTVEYNLSLFRKQNRFIKLSHSAGRVLEELIKYRKNCRLISREHLFENIWNVHGLQPSNGNLNQQISLIRKGLRKLGLNSSVIITIPKKGLKLNDQLIIKEIKNNKNSDFTINSDRSYFKKNILFSKNFISQNYIFQKYKTIFAFLLIFITGTGVFYTLHQKKDLNQKLYFFDQVNSCKVYTVNPIPTLEKNDYNTKVASVMQGEHCKKNYIVIFSRSIVADPLIQENINTRTFMAKCYRDEKERISNCLNFFFYKSREM
ncbi:MAG: winged helix-turn-helix domain-containing protein [Wigglesworthia glossinidia]|nr:winged helix-turn-helix domain-containing protein [Wigglesworthia glossinidia]